MSQHVEWHRHDELSRPDVYAKGEDVIAVVEALEVEDVFVSVHIPHVWWRLNHRPYFAFVFAPTSFDALVWLADVRTPAPLQHLEVERDLLRPTGITIARWGAR